MARVLLLTLVFSPDSVSTAVLMTELAQELQALGHELTVLTTTPHYNIEPEARARQPLQSRWRSLLYTSQCGESPVYHVSVPVKGSRVGARLLDYLRFHIISTLVGLTVIRKYDVILVPSPPLTIGLSAWVLRLFRRAPFIYNVQEIYPDIAIQLGVLQNKGAIRFFEVVERFVYRRARQITVISERFRQALLAKGVPAGKLHTIPNFVDTEFIQPGPRDNAFAQAHGLADKFVVLYAGNIGLTQSLEAMLASAHQLQDQPEIHFLIVGDGTRRAWLTEQLAHWPQPNVTLLPYQSRSVVAQIYASSDLCLVPLKRGTAQGTFPSKVYTIMAANRPVLVAADPESELVDVVQRANCGWVVPPDDRDSLVDAIRKAYQSGDECRTKARNGYAYVTRYHTRSGVAGQYDVLIRQVTHG